MNEATANSTNTPASIPQIEVRVWMKPTIYGGRSFPFYEGYSPHLKVKGKETWWGVWILSIARSPQGNAVFPGDEADLVCGLMYHRAEFDYGELKRGASFEMLEGPRVVGTGIVLSSFEW